MPSIDSTGAISEGPKDRKLAKGGESAGPADRALARWERLSARLFVFATNTLVTFLVVVAAVAFCRQVVDWWRESRPPTPESPPIHPGNLPDRFSMGSHGGPAETELTAEVEGDVVLGATAWMWTRRLVRGELNEAAQNLGVLTAAKVAEIAPAIVHGKTSPPPMEIDLGQLEQVKNLWHIQEVGNTGQVWILPCEVPVSLGVVKSGDIPEKSFPEKGRLLPVAFGLVRPRGEKLWQVDLFSWTGGLSGTSGNFADGVAGSSSWRFLPCRLPADARLLLACNTPLFGGQVAFRGTGPIENWMKFFDQSAPAAGWRGESEWQRFQTVWRRVFLPVLPEHKGKMEVLLAPTREGDYYGLIFWQS
jgi:hypothetical protein